MAQAAEFKGVASIIVTDEQGNFLFYYHGTCVVRYSPSKETVTLNSNGWLTVTTKRRMNQASNQFHLGFQVVQRAGDWYVCRPGHDKMLPYHDGMSFSVA